MIGSFLGVKDYARPIPTRWNVSCVFWRSNPMSKQLSALPNSY